MAVVTGHSHRPAIDDRGGVLFVNPGAAGPRRFRLPVTVARLRITDTVVTVEIVRLDVVPPAPTSSLEKKKKTR